MESNNITTFTDSIVFDVIKDIAHRAEGGLKKYNTTMDREDLIASDWVQHAYEEALDMAIYLKRLRKDMLAMEEELRAFKTQSMVREKLQEDAMKKTAITNTSTDTADFTRSIHITGTTNFTNSVPIGTGIVYTVAPKPNEIYTDLENHIKKIRRAWHF